MKHHLQFVETKPAQFHSAQLAERLTPQSAVAMIEMRGGAVW